MQQTVELDARVHFEDGMYWVDVPSHPGLFASGATLDDVTEALVEAWCLYAHDAVPSEVGAKGRLKNSRRDPRVRVDELKIAVPA